MWQQILAMAEYQIKIREFDPSALGWNSDSVYIIVLLRPVYIVG